MDGNNDKINHDLIAGFLASALDLEDKMSGNVYGEYLKRVIWPPDLEEEEFEIIKEYLNVLIQETEQHKKAFLSLQNKLASHGK